MGNKCSCGALLIETAEGHVICENYFKIIKENIENFQKAIEGSPEGDELEDNYGD